MKDNLIKIFWPILRIFEEGDEVFIYKPLHRKILLVIGVLFSFLACVSLYISTLISALGALIPIIVFFSVGAVCIIVACLGSEKAVAKIWRNK